MYHKRKNNKDLKYILQNLREQDKNEVKLIYGENWFDKVWKDFKNLKTARIGYKNDNTPVVVFGVLPNGPVGIIGMLSTSDIEKEQKSFLVLGKKWVKSQGKKYKALENKVYSSNVKAIKWLKWMGFTVEKNLGLGDKFLKFYKGDVNV